MLTTMAIGIFLLIYGYHQVTKGVLKMQPPKSLGETEMIGAIIGSSFNVLFLKLLRKQYLLGKMLIEVNLIIFLILR